MSISNLLNQYISASFQSLVQISSSGEIFDGNGNQINTLKVTSFSGSVSGIMASASYATTAVTASYISPTFISASVAASGFGSGGATLGSNTFTGTQTINGDVIITGNATAKQYIVSSSIYYVTQSYMSGSTKFGDTADDTHQFTGSLNLSGSHSGILPNTIHYGQNQYSDPAMYGGNPKRYYSLVSGGALGGVSTTPEVIYALPITISESRTIGELQCVLSDTSYTGSIRLAVYSDNKNIFPGNLIVSTSLIIATGSNTYSASVAATTLKSGVYWLAYQMTGSQKGAGPYGTMGFAVGGSTYAISPLLGYGTGGAASLGLAYTTGGLWNSGFPSTFPNTVNITLITGVPYIGAYFSA